MNIYIFSLNSLNFLTSVSSCNPFPYPLYTPLMSRTKLHHLKPLWWELRVSASSGPHQPPPVSRVATCVHCTCHHTPRCRKNPDKRRHFVNKEWHFKRSYPVGMCRLIHEAIVYIYDLKKHVGFFSIREARLALVVLPEFFLLQKSMKKFWFLCNKNLEGSHVEDSFDTLCSN